MSENSLKPSDSSDFESGDYTSSLHGLPLLATGQYDDLEEYSLPILTLNTRNHDGMIDDESIDEETEDYAPDPRNYYSHFYRESERLSTFHDWPHWAVVSKEDLAKNGFMYLHVSDRVQCVFCRANLASFGPGDVVANEHRKYCPECPFAFGYECGNIPIPSGKRVSQATSVNTLNRTNRVKTITAGNVASSSRISDVRQTTSTINRAVGATVVPQSQSAATLSSIDSKQAAAGVATEPTFQDWANESTRIRSYRGWPAHMIQTPRDLAAAGLLYMGQADRCKCYWCGGELHGWEPDDIPLVEHAKWFPQCGFVRQQKHTARPAASSTIVPPSQPSRLVNLSDGSVVMTAHGQQVAQPGDAMEESTSQSSADDQGLDHEPPSDHLTNHHLQDRSRIRDSSSLPSTRVPSDAETVSQENEKLKEQRICKVCMDKEVCIMIMPCRHLATCEECAAVLDTCPICRNRIRERVRVYWT